MMAKKDRFPPGYSTSFVPHYESEGSGSSGRIDSAENSSAPLRKWVDVNSALRDGFSVPMQTFSISKMISFERRSLALRLRSELEQIRLLQKKIEQQKTKFVNSIALSSSNDILSSSNAPPNGQQARTAKNAVDLGSDPGKKGRGWNRGITGRFESAIHNTRVNPNAGLLKQCEALLKKLMSLKYAWVFNTPVDPVKLNIPDYFDIIKSPMDLGTIESKLASGKYLSPLEFLADVRLTFSNAKTYNSPGTDVHIIANDMSQFFEARWKPIEKKISASNSLSLPEKSGIYDEAEITKPVGPSKKRKLSPVQKEVVQEPPKRRMTDEEKLKLSSELEDLLGDLPESVVEFLRAQSLNAPDGGEDEIEIDIDDLSDDTLFILLKLIDDHLQEKQKILDRSEACEIELPNVSGLSNSSLQADKGNDPTDEDIDIGGNEAPVTSYPPVEIGKDAVKRPDECAAGGPESRPTSDRESESSAVKRAQGDAGHTADSDQRPGADELMDVHSSVSGLDQVEKSSPLKPYSSDSDGPQDGEGAQAERPVSPDKLYRAALLKNRFLDTILKAREKTLNQDDKSDPEKLRREREELEVHKKREKARLQAEAKAAEDARRRAEAEAAAEAKRRRELEREAAREALLKMEKTVEINENSRFLEDLEMLRAAPPEQLLSSVEETSPDGSQDGFGMLKFGSSNPLEQLGLYIKADDDEEEGEPPSIPSVADEFEEGEI